MIIQAYMGCTLYESIVHSDVSFPVNFDKADEFGKYDCGGGRWYRPLKLSSSRTEPFCTRSKLSASGSPGMNPKKYME